MHLSSPSSTYLGANGTTLVVISSVPHVLENLNVSLKYPSGPSDAGGMEDEGREMNDVSMDFSPLSARFPS